MIDYTFSGDKTLSDIFNMVNPNSYQTLAIIAIIENKKSDAIQYLKDLEIAYKYYKWDSSDKNSDYIDSLICQSSLEKWQKIAIMYTLGNDIDKCIEYLKYDLDSHEHYNNTNKNDEYYRDKLLYESIMKFLHPSNTYPYWTTIPRRL